MKQVLPNPLYYLSNFQLVLEWVRDRYGDLLTEEERKFIDDFAGLPTNAMALLVRMVMRKGVFFRHSKLHYPEIGDVDAALTPLMQIKWVESDPSLTLDQLFDLSSKPELLVHFELGSAQKQLSKADLLTYLRESEQNEKPYSQWCPNSQDAVVHIRNKTICDRFRLIFFGNAHQDWSEFVLSDLGIYRYETIEISPESRGFQSRRDIDDYMQLQEHRELLEAGSSLAFIVKNLIQLQIDNTWINRRREKLLYQIGQLAEKDKEWDIALVSYEHSRYPGSRSRRIRVLEKTNKTEQALQLLTEALGAPENEAEIQQLQRSAPRLQRQLGQQASTKSKKADVDTITLKLAQPEQACSIEETVRTHLVQEDAPVFYVENTLINSLFGLLCWNAVFKPISGAFFHPFHRSPVDLTSVDFHQRREAEFAACFAQLHTGDYIATIKRHFELKSGIQSPFVSWGAITNDILDLALECIPPSDLQHWFNRILSDIKSNRNGFPDLIQFWPKERRYRMIEVKGPGDRLQDNQKRLIDFCHRHQMPISVCYLTWAEDV